MASAASVVLTSLDTWILLTLDDLWMLHCNPLLHIRVTVIGGYL